MKLHRSQEQPKVTLVVGDLSKSGAGRWGGAVRPFLLAQALKKIGCQTKIVGFTLADDLALPSTPDLPITSVNRENYPAFLRSAHQLLKYIDGDIIYAYKPKASSFGVSLWQKQWTKLPLILDIDDWELSWHGGDDWKYRLAPKKLAKDILKKDGALRKPDHPLYLKWMERLVPKADAVTVHTQFIQNRFGGTYVPNGKDVTVFDPDRYQPHVSKERYGLSDYRVLMFPGAPRPYKGLEDVLEALDQLNQPDLRLVIVGGSPYDDYDSKLMQKWGRWIIKLPKFPYEVMPDIISAADIVVVPQRDTPAAKAQFPLKLTDAMAMAKPILATRVGDIPSILNDAGYLVSPSSPDEIALQLQWIFNHLEEAKLKGQLARKRCIELYSIDSMAAILSGVIEQCLQPKAQIM